MNLEIIAHWIERSLLNNPPEELATFCGAYYSPYYLFMYLAARQSHLSGNLVELGVDQGRGLVALALSEKQIIGIDHTRKDQVNTVQEIYGNVLFLEQDATPLPDWFKNRDDKISLLHIDTEHSYSQAKVEFETYQPLLTNPAIVIFDDLHAQEDAVLEYFMLLPYPKIQDDRMHPTCGWGVMLYNE